MVFDIVDMEQEHLAQVVQIWAAGWTQGHAAVVPQELVALRNEDSFRKRMPAHVKNTRVAVCDGHVIGFHIVDADELYQMYVSAVAQGIGVAQDLIRDAEARIAGAGHKLAWLACAVGNARAARFYEKSGWVNAGLRSVALETLDAPYKLDVWRFEKAL